MQTPAGDIDPDDVSFLSQLDWGALEGLPDHESDMIHQLLSGAEVVQSQPAQPEVVVAEPVVAQPVVVQPVVAQPSAVESRAPAPKRARVLDDDERRLVWIVERIDMAAVYARPIRDFHSAQPREGDEERIQASIAILAKQVEEAKALLAANEVRLLKRSLLGKRLIFNGLREFAKDVDHNLCILVKTGMRSVPRSK
jgi:hypothetical protein